MTSRKSRQGCDELNTSANKIHAAVHAECCATAVQDTHSSEERPPEPKGGVVPVPRYDLLLQLFGLFLRRKDGQMLFAESNTEREMKGMPFCIPAKGAGAGFHSCDTRAKLPSIDTSGTLEQIPLFWTTVQYGFFCRQATHQLHVYSGRTHLGLFGGFVTGTSPCSWKTRKLSTRKSKSAKDPGLRKIGHEED